MGLTRRSAVEERLQEEPEDLLATSSRIVASESSAFEGRDRKCDDGVSIALLLLTLLGIGIGFFALLNQITMGRRRRRRSFDDDVRSSGMLDGVTDLLLNGNSNHANRLLKFKPHILRA